MNSRDQQIATLTPGQLNVLVNALNRDRGKYDPSVLVANSLYTAQNAPADAVRQLDDSSTSKRNSADLAPFDLMTGSTERAPEIGWTVPAPISEAEFAAARLAPRCIAYNLIYADVALRIAPGGVGKTTLELYEAVHIALKMPLYGRRIETPGPVIIITAEDSREMLVARLRLICEAMGLTAEQRAIVMRDVRISDVSGRGLKLTALIGDVVTPAAFADAIIEECAGLQPVLIVIDPAISFGIGESRVNDAEQGLIEAARRIRNALNCCVRFVHHSGKQNAREKAVDQYTGRGGSALADGSRMVAVLQPLTPDEWRNATGAPLLDGETGMVLVLPKLSYCPPQPDILICRKGYAFTHTTRTETDPGQRLQANCGQILRAIESDLDRCNRHSQRSLEALKLMPRAELRDTLSTLVARGLIENAPVPERHKGGQQTYLRPIAAPSHSGAPLENHGR